MRKEQLFITYEIGILLVAELFIVGLAIAGACLGFLVIPQDFGREVLQGSFIGELLIRFNASIDALGLPPMEDGDFILLASFALLPGVCLLIFCWISYSPVTSLLIERSADDKEL